MLTIRDIEKLDARIANENEARNSNYYLSIISKNSIFFEDKNRCYFILENDFEKAYVQIATFFALLDHIR